MKVKDLIITLLDYNMEAEVQILITSEDLPHNIGYDFDLSYGSSEGCTKKNCEHVSFTVGEYEDCEVEG